MVCILCFVAKNSGGHPPGSWRRRMVLNCNTDQLLTPWPKKKCKNDKYTQVLFSLRCEDEFYFSALKLSLNLSSNTYHNDFDNFPERLQ